MAADFAAGVGSSVTAQSTRLTGAAGEHWRILQTGGSPRERKRQPYRTAGVLGLADRNELVGRVSAGPNSLVSRSDFWKTWRVGLVMRVICSLKVILFLVLFPPLLRGGVGYYGSPYL